MATEIVSFHTDLDRVRMRNEIRQQIVAKLSDKEYRDVFVSEQINTGLAFQIRAMREQRGWTQSELGKKAGMAQSRISVMEDANYSRFNLSTLKRLASAFDAALIVRFEPFSNLVDHFVSLDSSSLNAVGFEDDTFNTEGSSFVRLIDYNLSGYELGAFVNMPSTRAYVYQSWAGWQRGTNLVSVEAQVATKLYPLPLPPPIRPSPVSDEAN